MQHHSKGPAKYQKGSPVNFRYVHSNTVEEARKRRDFILSDCRNVAEAGMERPEAGGEEAMTVMVVFPSFCANISGHPVGLSVSTGSSGGAQGL